MEAALIATSIQKVRLSSECSPADGTNAAYE
jgi:hypothetical protein